MDSGPREDQAAALLKERARAARDRRSWKIIAWVMAGALALLGYDSGAAAADAHRGGRPWAYPACVSAVCLLALAALTVRVLRRRRAHIADTREQDPEA